MAISKNVAKGEKILRLVLGFLLILLGLAVSGWWKPLSMIIGVLFIITALVGY